MSNNVSELRQIPGSAAGCCPAFTCGGMKRQSCRGCGNHPYPSASVLDSDIFTRSTSVRRASHAKSVGEWHAAPPNATLQLLNRTRKSPRPGRGSQTFPLSPPHTATQAPAPQKKYFHETGLCSGEPSSATVPPGPDVGYASPATGPEADEKPCACCSFPRSTARNFFRSHSERRRARMVRPLHVLQRRADRR